MKTLKLMIPAAAGILVTISAYAGNTVTITLDAAADSFFKYTDAAGTLHGTESSLLIKTDSGGKYNTRKSYVRFDLSSIDAKHVTDATLKFTVGGHGNATLSIWGYKDGIPNYDAGSKHVIGDRVWTDGAGGSSDEITLNTAPATWYDSGYYYGASMYPSKCYGGAKLGELSMNVIDGSVLLFTNNVTSFIQSDTTGDATFMFTLSNSAYTWIASREHATYAPPQLVLTIDRQLYRMITVTNDTYVKRGDNTAHGSETTMTIKNNSGNSEYDRNLYLQFDLSDIDHSIIPTNATLKIDPTSIAGGTHDVYVTAVKEDAAAEHFDEATLTQYNSDVWADNDTGVDPTKVTALGTVEVSSAGSTLSFSSAALLQAVEDDTDNILTLVLYRGVSNYGDQIAAKEHPSLHPPRLLIEGRAPQGTCIIVR